MVQEEKTSFLPIVLILLAGCGLFFALKWSHFGERDSAKNISVEDADRLVNKHLQETNEAIETQKMQHSVENHFSAPKIGQLVPFHAAPAKDPDLDIPEDSSQQQMHESFGSTNDAAEATDLTPRSVIESQLADKQRLEAYDEQYKERYIKEFVENARKNGWKLVVDKNGLVKSAQRIDSDQPTNIFKPQPSAEAE